MIARARETCRELSRRVRDDLVHLGLVDDTRTAKLRDGARAGAGDLIVARRNDHQLQAGEQQRTLANGDVMHVDRVNGDGSLTVRRRTGQDPQTGQARWSAATFQFADTANADLAYAITAHSAQGLTVSHGIAVVTSGEGRQWFYSAITRGADCNQAIVFTQPASLADPAAGTSAAPELARHERLQAERGGEPETAPFPTHNPDPREPVAVLADVLARDEAQQRRWTCWRANSATPTTWPGWTRCGKARLGRPGRTRGGPRSAARCRRPTAGPGWTAGRRPGSGGRCGRSRLPG